jgi:hypothetical protein
MYLLLKMGLKVQVVGLVYMFVVATWERPCDLRTRLDRTEDIWAL